MNGIDVLNVPHANARDEKGNPVFIAIAKNLVFSWYEAPSSKALHVVASGGAVVPVLMKAKEFEKIYFQKPQAEKVPEPTKTKPKLKGVPKNA